MPVQLRFRKHIAVGQKSKDESGLYGQGFNYIVEADFAYTEDEKTLLKGLNEVLKEVDHRHLGLDSRAIGEPTTANICAFIFQSLKEKGLPVTALRLERGDGLTASYTDS